MTTRNVLVQLDSLELGGAQINAVQLSAAARSRGWESTLIGPRDSLPTSGSSLLDVAAEYGVRVEPYDRPAHIGRHARELESWARRVDAEVVHCFSTSERAAYWGPGRFGRRALVRTIYEMTFDPRTHPRVPVVIGTGYLRDELQGRPGPVTLISPPVDLEKDSPTAVDAAGFRSACGVGPDDVLLVIVSRLAEEMKARGVEDTIAAVAALEDPTVRLLVVGTGDAHARLASLAEGVNRGLRRDAIRFTGAMADPRAAYAAADIVLGMGSSAARGLAFGKPLVVLGEYGWSEAFTPASSAALFRNSFWSPQHVADGAERLRATLASMIVDPALRASRGAFGAGFAAENFGLTAMAERLADLYDRVAREASRATWLRDLPFEAGMLRAKIERAIERRTAGRFRPSRAVRRLDWTQSAVRDTSVQGTR